MQAADDFNKTPNKYVIDVESELEMARLLQQDRLLTKHTGGLFPERSDLSSIHDALDIACGPGGWALQVAHAYPAINVVGVDISIRMIQYARAQAIVQEARNARFLCMDVLEPLEFPENSFDLINARLLFGFLSATTWPQLLQECLRILRPGGIIRLTEVEYILTNSPACEELAHLFTEALHLAGRCFSPDGRHIGITVVLGSLLRQAGYRNTSYRPFVIDSSAYTSAHESWYQDMQVALKLLQPFLIKVGVAQQEKLDELYQRAMEEMRSPQYCAVGYGLTVWGEKATTTS